MAYEIQIPSMRCLSIAFLCMTIISQVLPFPSTFESLDFSLQITVPITSTLPTFLLGRKYKKTYQNGQNYYRNKRSLQVDSEEVLDNDLDGIFSHLGLHNVSCQQKLICLITENPKKYSPISEVVFRQLDLLNQQQSGSDWNRSSSTLNYMDMYDDDMSLFSPLANCSQTATACDRHPDENIDWNTINAWQNVMNFITLEFK